MGLGTQTTSGNQGSNSSWQMAMINLLKRILGLPTKDSLRSVVSFTDTPIHTLFAAVPDYRNVITDLLVTNADTSIGTFVEFRETSASGTLLWKGYCRAEGGFNQPSMSNPIVASKGVAIVVKAVTDSADIVVCATGFKFRD